MDDDEDRYVGVNEYMTYGVLWRYIWRSVAVMASICALESWGSGTGPDPGGWLLVGTVVGVPFGWAVWALIRSVNNLDEAFFGHRRR